MNTMLAPVEKYVLLETMTQIPEPITAVWNENAYVIEVWYPYRLFHYLMSPRLVNLVDKWKF